VTQGTKMEDEDLERLRWDWVTFTVALLIAVFLGVVTFELWVSHGPIPHAH
jgi:hypothetical protein